MRIWERCHEYYKLSEHGELRFNNCAHKIKNKALVRFLSVITLPFEVRGEAQSLPRERVAQRERLDFAGRHRSPPKHLFCGIRQKSFWGLPPPPHTLPIPSFRNQEEGQLFRHPNPSILGLWGGIGVAAESTNCRRNQCVGRVVPIHVFTFFWRVEGEGRGKLNHLDSSKLYKWTHHVRCCACIWGLATWREHCPPPLSSLLFRFQLGVSGKTPTFYFSEFDKTSHQQYARCARNFENMSPICPENRFFVMSNNHGNFSPPPLPHI